MLLRIQHEINYCYTKPVFFEPHTFYMRPREDGSQKIAFCEINIEPEPMLRSWNMDIFGNVSLQTWFEGKHERLVVKASSEVETLRENPFNYFPAFGFSELKHAYPQPMRAYLQPYFFFRDQMIPLEIQNYAERIALKSGSSITAFLPILCQQMFSDFKKVIRPVGAAWSPDETFKKKEGSCRDLALLFMACCESQHLATRFVSGYFEGDSEKLEKDLHAWVEVYVEGGGWRGFDPTYGLIVNESYVPLAAAPSSERVSPSIGTIRGDGVKATLSTKIEMHSLPSLST